jgi:hypothetical protein
MDFAAWFEACLDGRWYSFDARNNVPRIGRIFVARGRDTADVTINTTFQLNIRKYFKVHSEDIRESCTSSTMRDFI